MNSVENNRGGGECYLLIGRTEFLLAAGTLILLAPILLPLPPSAIDVLLLCTASLTAALLMITLRARTVKELANFPALMIAAICLHLGSSTAAARSIILNDGVAGRVIAMVSGSVVELNPIACTFALAAAAVMAAVLTYRCAARIRSAAAGNITALAGAGELIPSSSFASGMAFNVGIGGAARYLVFDAATTFPAVLVSVLSAWAFRAGGGREAVEPAAYTSSALGAGVLTIAPVVLLSVAVSALMGRDFVSAGGDGEEPGRKEVVSRAVEKEGVTVREANFSAAAEEPPQKRQAAALAAAAARDADEEGAELFFTHDYEYDSLAEAAATAPGKRLFISGMSIKDCPVTVPVNVAARMAMRRQRVLLIDTDASRDAIAKCFEIAPGGRSRRGPRRTYIKRLYVWPANTFCSSFATTEKKIELFERYFDKVVLYCPRPAEVREAKDSMYSASAMLFAAGTAGRTVWLAERMKDAGCEVIGPAAS